MATKVRLSYRIDEDVARMITDLAAKHRIEKTLVVEIAIRRLFDDPAALEAAFPVSTNPPEPRPTPTRTQPTRPGVRVSDTGA